MVSEEYMPTDEGATMATRAIVGTYLAKPEVIYSDDYLPADVNIEYKPAQPPIIPAGDTNLITNGTFATDLSGWTVVDATSSVRSATLGEEGQPCLRTIGDGSGTEAVHQTAACLEGYVYHLSLDVWSSIVDSARASIEWYTSGMSLISTSSEINNGDWQYSWTPKSSDFIAPATAAFARVILSIPSNSTAESRFNNVSLTQAPPDVAPVHPHIQIATVIPDV